MSIKGRVHLLKAMTRKRMRKRLDLTIHKLVRVNSVLIELCEQALPGSKCSYQKSYICCLCKHK